MEKISSIVRGNSRVTTSDNKSASTARPGMPAFGREPGESTAASEKTSSTASRAVALHNGIVEAKKAMTQERVVAKIADDFFMSHGRRPGENVEATDLPVPVPKQLARSTDELVNIGEVPEEEMPMPEPKKGYTPRGSFVNVLA